MTNPADQPPVVVSVRDVYADYIREEETRTGLDAEEIVRRSLGLYCLLVKEIEAGKQMVVLRLEDDHDLPALTLIDHYSPPDETLEIGQRVQVDPRRHLYGELVSWPDLEPELLPSELPGE